MAELPMIIEGQGLMEVRTVTIPAQAEHRGQDARTVKLRWICQVCGKPRGDVFKTESFDGSRKLSCHGWLNPCGHVDKYDAVRIEALVNGLNP